jgi:hypothetical protein
VEERSQRLRRAPALARGKGRPEREPKAEPEKRKNKQLEKLTITLRRVSSPHVPQFSCASGKSLQGKAAVSRSGSSTGQESI